MIPKRKVREIKLLRHGFLKMQRLLRKKGNDLAVSDLFRVRRKHKRINTSSASSKYSLFFYNKMISHKQKIQTYTVLTC